MLTRLKVSGFKNLMNIDVHFGPFTCIAGVNAVGKSNLFDAIRLLSELAQTNSTLTSAAKSIRNDDRRASDIRELFMKIGDIYLSKMDFEVEMIIPSEGEDESGQVAKASTTSVKYKLSLSYQSNDSSLRIDREELEAISILEARKNIGFTASDEWKKSAIFGRRNVPFISTDDKNNDIIIRIHQDGEKGKPFDRKASTLKKTVLSTADSSLNPTAALVKMEMQSWKLLQLEPSALRKEDEFEDIGNSMGSDGSHLPATLYRLTQDKTIAQIIPDVCQTLANKLSELVDNIREISVDKDDFRRLLTIHIKNKSGTTFPAKALSDGTLRFLGLSIIELDLKANGVVCLEEPENGIHPDKIKSMIGLLERIAIDTMLPVSIDNPLRQVVINTHSPIVVGAITDDSLLMADTNKQISEDGTAFFCITLGCLKNTWRTKQDPSNYQIISRGRLLNYLNPPPDETEDDFEYPIRERKRRVLNLVQLSLFEENDPQN